LTKEEFQEWWYLPQTQEVVAKLKEFRQAVVDEILESRTLSDNAGMTAQMTARAVGEIAGLDFFIEKRFQEDE
jgi:hypothetical protein